MRTLTLLFVSCNLCLLSACTIYPEPLTTEGNRARVEQDLAVLFRDQEPLRGPLSLDEAIARGLRYNLDHRLKLMEEAVAHGQLEVANMRLLPEVVSSYSAYMRNNSDSTFNRARTTTSISSDRHIRPADLTVSWNVLDFAIGYVRAHQQADLALMVEERRRSVIHSIVNDTRRAYWRAVAAERALARLGPMLGEVRVALDQAQVRVEERVGAPLDALTYQKDLLVTLRELETRSRQLVEARTELAVLLNVHPGDDFTLLDAAEDPAAPTFPELSLDVQELELAALHNRSELRSEAYQLRANQREARIAILEMIPGLSFSPGINYTSDSYKLHDSWYDASIGLSWNLMNLMRGPRRRELVESQIDVSKVRRLALSMAVISQVNIAKLRFDHARDDYLLTRRLASVNNQIADRLGAGAKARTVGQASRIQGEVRSFLSSLQRDMAYADMQSAFGALFASIGLDPLPGPVDAASIEALASAVAEVQARWAQGDHSAISSPEP